MGYAGIYASMGLHGTNSGGKASTCHLTVGDTADILSHFSLGAQPASAGACDYVALAVLMRCLQACARLGSRWARLPQAGFAGECALCTFFRCKSCFIQDTDLCGPMASLLALHALHACGMQGH